MRRTGTTQSKQPRAAENERGQVVPLVAVVVLIAGLMALGLGRVGQAAVSRARAQTAADAAALGGAADGRSAADALATANGAHLDQYEELGSSVRVHVSIGDAHAVARAERLGTTAGGGKGSTKGLAPGMLAAIARAEELLGTKLPISSGFRSRADQARLYGRRGSNPYPVAPPGSSLHERGLAIDVPMSFVPRLLTVAARAGLCRPYPAADPVHFELCRPR